MPSRNQRAAIATETVQIISSGSYTGCSGRTVSILPELNHSINNTRLFTPGQLSKLVGAAPAGDRMPRIHVRNFTTLDGARQLHEVYGAEGVVLLNFASARNPGGGFLNGSQAQEESLVRASGLYGSISRMTDYYGANRRSQSAL